MGDSTGTPLGLAFSCGDLSAEDLQLVGIKGRERLGDLFEYRLYLRHQDGPLSDDDLAQLLRYPCSFTFGRGDDDVIHGIVRKVALLEVFPGRPALYLATVVPTVWLLTLSRMSRTVQGKTTEEMVSDLFRAYGLVRETDFDWEMPTSGLPEEAREFRVQYEESDWTFIERWLERDGLTYWFQHQADHEKLMVGSPSARPEAISGVSALPLREQAATRGQQCSILNWGMSTQRAPAQVVLRDYNYRQPALPLMASAVVGGGLGFGTVFSYGEHFRRPEEGTQLARAWAGRLLCEQTVFRGLADCPHFRVGHTFSLAAPPDGSRDGSYLITSVDYQVGSVQRAEGDGDETGEIGAVATPGGYCLRFEAIPVEVPFFPECRTPWPSIHGVMHAHIDSDGAGAEATIDQLGRYRVRLPFDVSGSQGERASQWMRMAQPYSGDGYGSHFPLHKGAEVILGFIDGNPDRPIILGAVPNAYTQSPSSGVNATQSVIKTASGIRIELEDRK